jgi:hypothetical protein
MGGGIFCLFLVSHMIEILALGFVWVYIFLEPVDCKHFIIGFKTANYIRGKFNLENQPA